MTARAFVIFAACAALLILQVPSARAEEPIVSHIPREQVGSSALAAIGYSKRLHALEIEFRNGAIYRYLDVPPEVYRALLAAPSKARYYDEHVRGQYRSLHVKPRTS